MRHALVRLGGAAPHENRPAEKRHDDGFRVFRWAHDPYPGSSENEYHRWLHTLRALPGWAHPDEAL